ncbi:hypothetical protein ACKWTF_004145 [Chironomus riparius]
MGVRQLQTYVKNYVLNGYINVSLYDECKDFKRQYSTKPILLIDLHSFLRILLKDLKEVLCGIRHQKVYERLEEFLEDISQIADLVFYNEGPVFPAKLSEWINRQNQEFTRAKNVLELINQERPLEEIIERVKNIEVPISHFEIVESLAKKYGTLKTAVDKECDTEMAQYACQDPLVLAILADDSDFLIFPGNWRYFSLRDLDQKTFETKEYNRVALRENLGLNDQELVLLSTLNGNDVISFDKDSFYFHKKLVKERYSCLQRFPAIAQYIKDNNLLDKKNLLADVANRLFDWKFKLDANGCIGKVRDSFKFYDVASKNEIPDSEDATMVYCRQKSYYFVHSILSHMTVKLTFNYFDHERSNNFFTTVNCLFRKEIGIILKDKPFRRYRICSKMSHADEKYEMISFNPIIPKFKQPPLIELLDRLQYPEHDELRFKLLKWLICEQKDNHINFESIPQNIFLDVLALIYMVHEGLIDVIEADIILLSIKHVENGDVPEELSAPEILHPRAFYVSMIFSYCHYHVTRCLEITGLKSLTKLLNFDGVLFHNIFREHINQPFDYQILLADFANYRHYV